MKTIPEKQDAIVADFIMMGDEFNRFAYLLELAGQLPVMDSSAKTDTNLVKGCQSSVWLDIRVINGIFYFTADSDTLTIKGILYLLQDILCGQPAIEVSRSKLDFIQRTKLMSAFTNDRQKGVGFIIRTLLDKAIRESRPN